MGMNDYECSTSTICESAPEVFAVKRELSKIGIFLEAFGVTITKIYTKPRPFGFDFYCRKPEELLALARKNSALGEDHFYSKEGRISSLETPGTGLRQIGSGPRVHLEIALSGRCNAHIDSHGFTVADGKYDYNRAFQHGYWDLLSDKAPWLFGAFGTRGQVGPMVQPMPGLDGRVNYIVGFNGIW